MTTPALLRREIRGLVFDQYGTVVAMQNGPTDAVTPFGVEGSARQFVTWARVALSRRPQSGQCCGSQERPLSLSATANRCPSRTAGKGRGRQPLGRGEPSDLRQRRMTRPSPNPTLKSRTGAAALRHKTTSRTISLVLRKLGD